MQLGSFFKRYRIGNTVATITDTSVYADLAKGREGRKGSINPFTRKSIGFSFGKILKLIYLLILLLFARNVFLRKIFVKKQFADGYEHTCIQNILTHYSNVVFVQGRR